MATGLIWKTLAVATLSAGLVWLLTIATFRPQVYATVEADGEVVYVDNRPFCSNMIRLPHGPSGVGLPTYTFPPSCRLGPIPADALAPSPVPAVAIFLLVGSLGLVLGIRRARGPL
jgi:hypothetical protein